MDRIFESCVDVTFPQTNGKVVEDLMCDGKTGEDCTPKVSMVYNDPQICGNFTPQVSSKSSKLVKYPQLSYSPRQIDCPPSPQLFSQFEIFPGRKFLREFQTLLATTRNL